MKLNLMFIFVQIHHFINLLWETPAASLGQAMATARAALRIPISVRVDFNLWAF